MAGLGFSGALRGFERRVWSVTVFFSCVSLSFVLRTICDVDRLLP